VSVFAKRTVSSQTTSTTIAVNHKQSDFKISLAVVVDGVLTYQVEHTFDDVQDSSVTPGWFINDGLVNKSLSEDGNIAFPVRGVRLNVTAFTSGSATLTLNQAQ
jgi:archaellum component FlaG (FlaF/FlaG flagellin family)